MVTATPCVLYYWDHAVWSTRKAKTARSINQFVCHELISIAFNNKCQPSNPSLKSVEVTNFLHTLQATKNIDANSSSLLE